MSPPDGAQERGTALGLEQLRGDLREGLAEIKGSLQLLVLRSEQTERVSREHADQLDRHDERLDALETAQQATGDLSERVLGIERKVWAVAGGIAVLTFVVDVALRVYVG